MVKRTSHTLLYTSLLRWEPLVVEGSEGLAWIKTLAKNEETGARTALVRFDPGYKQAKSIGQGAADIYVLEGEMGCGELAYKLGTYQYRPRGTEFGPIECPNGITRLVFQAGPDDPVSAEPVFIADVAQLPWQQGYNTSYWGTVKDGIKSLREDKLANLSVLITALFIPGLFEKDVYSQHDHFEEALVLQGEAWVWLDEIDGHHVFEPGLYLYREPYSSGHGDVLTTKAPRQMFVRRGWVGDMTKFGEQREKAAGGWLEIPPVPFRE